jgi:hypothetical protein
MANPPAEVISWPDSWDIERVAGWLADADAAVWPKLTELKGSPASADDLARVLRENKANVIMYEVLAAAIADTPACARRATELLSAIATACAGKATPRFSRNAAIGVLIFVP